MEFQVLGPVRVVGGAASSVGGPLQRRLLGSLLCRSGRSVPADVLADELWPDEGDVALQRLQVNVHRLRKVLDAPDRITFDQGSYRLRVGPDELDADRFESLRAAGLDAVENSDPNTGATLLREALELWRGTPYEEIDLLAVKQEADRLEEARLATLEALYDVELAAGRASIAELRELTENHPLRERFAAQLMLALYHSDRQAEALDVYLRTRTHLVEQLGVEPGRELRRIQSSILAGERPELAEQSVVPRQLPPGLDDLIGRDTELGRLDRLLIDAQDNKSAPAIVVVTGPAGVGKTSLALHWAHQVKDRYADGQLYVNLHGYSADEPVDAGVVLETFLRAFGVGGARIPASTEERSALFRTVTARRRLLIVLDNAHDAAQLRPLLPSPGALIIVTSRGRLRGLATRYTTHRLELTELDEGSAVRLLQRGLPTEAHDERTAAQLSTIAGICGRLPLALALAAELVGRGGEELTALVEDLRDEQSRLDRLAAPDDPESDVRAVVSWSYQALGRDAGAARLFRLLGLQPSGEFSSAAAAAIAGEPERQTRLTLDTLLAVNLVQQPRPRRYQLHDLVRLYAAEMLARDEPDPDRIAARDRLFDWYTQTAENARREIRPFALRPDLGSPLIGVQPLEFADVQEALTWFDQEHDAVVGLIHRAVGGGYDAAAHYLGTALAIHLQRRYSLTESTAILEVARAAAQRLGHRIGEATALNRIGTNYSRIADYPAAVRAIEEAVRIFRELGDGERESAAEGNLGLIHRLQGDPKSAVRHQQIALELAEQHGTPNDVGGVLNNLAMAYLDLGRIDEAVAATTQAIALHRDSGDDISEGYAAETLAGAHAARSEYREAVRWYERAIEIARNTADQWIEADALRSLGLVLRETGQTGKAHAAWTRALWLLDQIDAPDNAKLSRTDLSGLLESVSPGAGQTAFPLAERREHLA